MICLEIIILHFLWQLGAAALQTKAAQKQGCLARLMHIVCSLEKLISSAASHCSAYSACLEPCLITISTSHSVQKGTIISDKTCILFLGWSCITSSLLFPSELLPNLLLQLSLTWLAALRANACLQLTEVASWCFLTTCRRHLLLKFSYFLATVSCLLPPTPNHWFRYQ